MTIVAATGVLGCGGAHLVRADTHVTPFAIASVAHNSNVFMRPTSAPPLAAQGIDAFGDMVQSYEGGMDAEFDWGAERLTIRGQGTRDLYKRFSFLDHTEYRLKGTFDWRAGPVIDGTFFYSQSRVMAPFADTLSTELLLNTEQIALATVRVRISPEWRIDLTPEYHKMRTPLPTFPFFDLREDVATGALEYLGFGKLMAGLRFRYTHGRYTGIVSAIRYDQREADLTAHYKVSGFSTFEGSVGYTIRDAQPNVIDSLPNPGVSEFAGYVGTVGRTSSVTGSISYHRQLTGKTSVFLTLYRAVESYTAGANPEIGTGGSAGLTWRADPKFTVDMEYSLTHHQIRGSLVVANVVNRSDRTQWGRVSIRYAALSWLAIRPYVVWTQESSTFVLGNYTSTVVGIDVIGRFGR